MGFFIVLAYFLDCVEALDGYPIASQSNIKYNSNIILTHTVVEPTPVIQHPDTIDVLLESGEKIHVPKSWRIYYLQVLKQKIFKEMNNSNLDLHKKTMFKVTLDIPPELFQPFFGTKILGNQSEVKEFFGEHLQKAVNQKIPNSDVFLVVPPMSIKYHSLHMEVGFDFKKKRCWDLPSVQH